MEPSFSGYQYKFNKTKKGLNKNCVTKNETPENALKKLKKKIKTLNDLEF